MANQTRVKKNPNNTTLSGILVDQESPITIVQI